jgi:hypothetical protein
MMRVALLVAALGLGGCHQDDFGPDDFVAAYRDAYCRHLVRCRTYAALDACLADSKAVPAGDQPDRCALESIDAGRLVWHADQAHACIDAIGTWLCGDHPVPSECFSVSTGAVEPGDACMSRGDCRFGSCEVSPDPDEECALGTCSGGIHPPVPVGGSCRTSVDCVVGAYCSQYAPGHGGLFCFAFLKEGEECYYWQMCEPGLQCTNNVCKRPRIVVGI